MAVLTIRNVTSETHRALKVRAAQAGRSTEAELRLILDQAVNPVGRLKLGSALHALARKHGGFELPSLRDRKPALADAAQFD